MTTEGENGQARPLLYRNFLFKGWKQPPRTDNEVASFYFLLTLWVSQAIGDKTIYWEGLTKHPKRADIPVKMKTGELSTEK